MPFPDLVPLLLLMVANGAPIITEDLLGSWLNQPVDGGRRTGGGKRWLGDSKTWRGVLMGSLLPAVTAPLLGVDWWLGALVGALAMLGDLLASFTKRRLGRDTSSQAQGLDQVPESLLPLALCAGPLDLTVLAVVANVAAFWVLELLLSRVLFCLHLRKRPY